MNHIELKMLAVQEWLKAGRDAYEFAKYRLKITQQIS